MDDEKLKEEKAPAQETAEETVETAEDTGGNKDAVKSDKEEKQKKKDKKNKDSKDGGLLESLKAQIAEKDDKFLRLAAEYDNFRKRSAKEKSDIYSSSKADVINEILPILDNFERAAMNSEADFESYKKGIELIFNQFLGVLSKFGVESFGEEGETFDPAIHSAVMITEDPELGSNVIAQVFSKGYRIGDKIIREAVVKVANT